MLCHKKVQLHVHLDGAVRLETILDLALRKGVPLPGNDVDSLKSHFCSKHGSLADFLHCFSIFMPTFIGDTWALTRIAYEFCEDIVASGVVYCEVRFAPHLLTSTSVGVEAVLEAVLDGLSKGQQQFTVKVRVILCCMAHEPAWAEEVLRLCVKYRQQGVVGIDLAGDEHLGAANRHLFAPVFQRAAELGVHRTVHAGEAGGPDNVKKAVDELCAERIGHGYHALDDESVYGEMRARDVHFELCPQSSYHTHAVCCSYADHPIVRFCADGANYSVSTDDPLLTDHSLQDEYEFLRTHMNITDHEFARTNLNAARACFLPEDEKQQLIALMEGCCNQSSMQEGSGDFRKLY